MIIIILLEQRRPVPREVKPHADNDDADAENESRVYDREYFIRHRAEHFFHAQREKARPSPHR